MQTGDISRWIPWKASLSLIWQWALLALVLHLLWEVAHLRLYLLAEDGNRWRVTLYMAHCVLGDVAIATLTYLLVAMFWRQMNWPRQRMWAGGMMLVALGMGYTAFSEWYNVYQIQSWVYSETMPLIFGIGVTPLLQWLIVPGVMLFLIRRTRIGRSWRKLSGSPSLIFF
jgi:hypothetical protein